MCDCDSLIGKLEETLDAMDGKLVPRHVGNGLYIVEGMGLMCNREFLDEVDRVILQFDPTEYQSYEEACEAAIKYCLENLI